MRIGTCPHCFGDVVLTESPCDDHDRPAGAQPCPLPGVEHGLVLCQGDGCPHPDAVHIFVEANLEAFAPALEAAVRAERRRAKARARRKVKAG